jgi:hypothetical protein
MCSFALGRRGVGLLGLVRDDESLTDDEDLQFLLDGELEAEDNDDDVSWEGHHSSSEEEDDDESTEEGPMVGSFLCARSSDEDDNGDDGGDSDDETDGDDGSTSDDGAGDDGSGDYDGDVGAIPPIKPRRFSGTYWGDRLLLRNDPSFMNEISFFNLV